MPWLFIDTSTAGLCRFGLLGGKKNEVREVAARSGSLLPLLSKHVGLAKIKRAQGICVVAGPGSFSSVRGGVLAANLLSRILNLPLVGVSVAEARGVSALARRLLKHELVPVSFVPPVYAAEPNITLKSA